MDDNELSALLAAMPTADEAVQLLAVCRMLLLERAMYSYGLPGTFRALSSLVQAIDARTEKP